jgi:hypothetical protein
VWEALDAFPDTLIQLVLDYAKTSVFCVLMYPSQSVGLYTYTVLASSVSDTGRGARPLRIASLCMEGNAQPFDFINFGGQVALRVRNWSPASLVVFGRGECPSAHDCVVFPPGVSGLSHVSVPTCDPNWGPNRLYATDEVLTEWLGCDPYKANEIHMQRWPS